MSQDLFQLEAKAALSQLEAKAASFSTSLTFIAVTFWWHCSVTSTGYGFASLSANYFWIHQNSDGYKHIYLI
jgi:hypothetical protein